MTVDKNKLYIVYKLRFDPRINQDDLREAAGIFKQQILNDWEDARNVPKLLGVDYELVMEVGTDSEDQKS